MSTAAQIFWLNLKRLAKHHAAEAVDRLIRVGATLQQAVRWVAMARSQAVAT